MRLIIEAFGRAWLWSFHTSRTDEPCEVSSHPEFEQAPVDPHSARNGQFELGFHGRQE